MWYHQPEFDKKWEPEPMSGCWLWHGSADGRGYGIFRGKRAHRVSYVIHVGEIAPGLQLHHLCQVTACVNPAHLEALTPQAHARRPQLRKLSNMFLYAQVRDDW